MNTFVHLCSDSVEHEQTQILVQRFRNRMRTSEKISISVTAAYLLLNCHVKTNELYQNFHVILLLVRTIQFAYGMEEHLVKCTVMQANGNKQQQRCTICNHIGFVYNNAEGNLSTVPIKRALIPW